MVLKRTAAAKKQMVATIPATTGRASPRSSTNSGGGKKSEGEERGRQKHNEVEQQIHDRNRALYSRYFSYFNFILLTELLTWPSFILMLYSAFNLWLQNRDWYLLWDIPHRCEFTGKEHTVPALWLKLNQDFLLFSGSFICKIRAAEFTRFCVPVEEPPKTFCPVQ